MKHKIVRSVSLAVSILASLSCLASTTPPQKKPVRPATDVGAEIVLAHDVQQSLTLVGKLEGQQSVEIKPEVAGKISRINVTSNQVVKAGQRLVEIDKTKAQAALNEAKAYLIDERRKEREYSKLVSKNAITQTELDAQRASVDIAKARLDAATAELSYMQIKAPFAGTIGFIDFSNGKMVTVGEDLFTLDNLSNMRLDLQVPEKYLSQISIGMEVKTTSRAWKNEQFAGKVTHINTRVNAATLSVPVRVNIPNKGQKLKPGMLMSATIHFPTIHKPIIPVQAMEYAGTKRFVYIITTDAATKTAKVIRSEITLGDRIEDKIVVNSGLKVGQQVVTKGLVNMRDGMAVKVVEETKMIKSGTLKQPDLNTNELKADDAKIDAVKTEQSQGVK
ncbi:efflux RND transporter periplasmic adaptor subunit [Vibrio algicola]|uniref:Efflux RND transporter periplasmic adaptor subunit n=1 Tax=Vibrio algicola TaxID=2662262 RepID=A0A5Q0TIH8_9VIBR|nr:efflux RND transporter periplasmic adaptor subunit [Vibrio algicola]